MFHVKHHQLINNSTPLFNIVVDNCRGIHLVGLLIPVRNMAKRAFPQNCAFR